MSGLILGPESEIAKRKGEPGSYRLTPSRAEATRFELVTPELTARCSTRLSYASKSKTAVRIELTRATTRKRRRPSGDC